MSHFTRSFKNGLPITTKPSFGIRTKFDFFIIRHEQVLGTFSPFGFDLQLSPVFHFTKSYLGFQIKWHQVIATHIDHSDYVKSTFDDIYDAKGELIQAFPENGWYRNTGSSLNVGIEWFKPIRKTLNLNLDSGLIFFNSPYTGLVDAMMIGQVPFYANIVLSYKLK